MRGLGIVVLERLGEHPSRSRFVAHRSSPVSALAFSADGSLLVTASETGKTLKVFRLGGSGGEEPRLVYKLVRGTLMDAEICSVSFSADGLWIAVATSHGTAHVFAISPNGGHVDAVTHGIAGIAARPVEAPLEEADVPSLSAVARVKRSWIPSNVVSQGLPETQQATFYTIRCFTMGGGHWDVHKRYSELNALKTLLEAHPQTAEALAAIEKNAPFPAKTWGLGSWGKLDEGTIGERKEGLQLWLGNVLQHCPNEPSVLEFLRPAQVRRQHSPCRVGISKTG